MANNRMYIKCDMCGDEKHIAKYYPSTGWNLFITENHEPVYDGTSINDSLNKFFEEHRHGVFDVYGPQHFSVSFEASGEGFWGSNP